MRLSSRPDVLRLQAKSDVDGLVQALGYKADPRIRETAADALVAIGSSAIPALVQALSSSHLQVPAMVVLRKIGVLTINPLLNVIKTDNRQNVRKAAEQVLADIGMFSIEPLMSLLSNTNPEIRQSALNSLVSIGSLSVEPLIKQLKKLNQPEYVRLDAIKALSELGGTMATPALIQAAQNDPSVEVRKKAAEVVGRHDLITESAKSNPQPVKKVPRRGLSHRFKGTGAKVEAGHNTQGSKIIDSRWSRMRQTLPLLKDIPNDVFQQLKSSHNVQRRHNDPDDLIEDLDAEYKQYSRIKESAYTDLAIRVVFDNEIVHGDREMPATRQMQVTIVKQQRQFYLFINATYIEHYW